MNPVHYAARFPRILLAVGEEAGEAYAARLSEGVNMPTVLFESREALLAELIPGRDALVVTAHDSEPACREFFKAVRQLDPGIPVMSISSIADTTAAYQAERAGLDGWISTPIANDTLDALRIVMDMWRKGHRPGFLILNDQDPAPSSTGSKPAAIAPREPREFTVLVFWGNEMEAKFFGEMAGAILDPLPHRIIAVPTRHMADALKLPEMRQADFVLFRLNAFEVSKEHPKEGRWMPMMEEFVTELRAIAGGALFCSTYWWLPTTREGLLRAGADYVEPCPFKANALESALQEAHKLWLAEKPR